VLEEMSRNAGVSAIDELVAWALPTQQQHFERALAGTKKLPSEEDPNEASG
jgi:hypothetical protein